MGAQKTVSADRAELQEALRDLVEQCKHVSPFSGKEGSVKSLRKAMKFMAAYERAKQLLGDSQP